MRAPYSRSKDVALALLVWSCSVCFAASAARQTAQRNQDTLAKSYLSSSEDLVRQLKTLFERWKAIPAAERATKSSPIKNEVDATVSNYVSSRLTASSRPSASGLQTEVSKALAVATWESVFGLSPEAAVEAWNSNRPKLAFLVQGTGNASGLYVAGFSVGYGNTFSVFIHGFGPVASANYGPVGTTGRELDGSTPKAERIKSFDDHELRVVAWGLHIGSADGLTSVAIYSFDGQQLRTIWTQPSVPRAAVRLSDDRVVIDSEEPLSRREGTWTHKREQYEQIPEGLKLIETKSWTTR